MFPYRFPSPCPYLVVFIDLSTMDTAASVTPPNVVFCGWPLGQSAMGLSGLLMDLSPSPVPPCHQNSPSGCPEGHTMGQHIFWGQHENKGRAGGMQLLRCPLHPRPRSLLADPKKAVPMGQESSRCDIQVYSRSPPSPCSPGSNNVLGIGQTDSLADSLASLFQV